MKIAVIGATGTVGSAVVAEAAARGHEVVAFARNTDKVAEADGVTAVSADVNDAGFSEQLKGFDAVVAAYNAGWTNPNIVADLQKGWASIFAAAKKANVPYLTVVGGAGSLYIAPDVQLVDTPEFAAEVFPAANVMRNLLTELKDRRDLNWTFISPPAGFLGDVQTRSGSYRTGADQVLFTGDNVANISAPDLACAIVDDAERKAHLFTRFTVAEAL